MVYSGFSFFQTKWVYNFFNADGGEPRHIHVERDDKTAKFWLEPVELQTNKRFSQIEIRTINKIIVENRLKLLEAWNDYFHG